MPNRWPISDGNWSSAAIWSGSLIPTSADDVFLNNRTVTLDQTITVRSIQNNSTTGVTAGGLLNIFSDYNITVTPTGLNSGGATVTGGFIKYYNSGSITVTSTFLQTRNTLENVNNGTINIIGEIRFPSTIGSCRTVTNSSTGTIIVTGSITSPAATTSLNYAIQNSSSGSIFISGSIVGGSNGAGPYGINNASTGTVTVIGNVTGGTKPDAGSTSTAYGIHNASAGIVTVTGSVRGGPVGVGANTNPVGIFNASIGTILVSGSVSAGTGSGAIGVASTSAGTIIIQGPISSSINNVGVSSTSTTAVNLFTGPFYNTGSYNAVYAYRMQVFDRPTQYTFGTETDGVTKTLTTVESIVGAPSASNVRNGVTYGLNGNLTGSLKMPDPTTVKQGVLTDNTTGSAILTAEDMFGVLTQNITTSGSIGTVLTGASTVQTVGATISAFKV
jgi:hypothetical protein